jgi:hypothetical protein
VEDGGDGDDAASRKMDEFAQVSTVDALMPATPSFFSLYDSHRKWLFLINR